MKGRKIPVWTAATVMAGALVAVALFGPSLLEPTPALQLPGNPACDMQQGPCSVSLPEGGRMIVEVQPRPIPVMRPIGVDVRFESVEAESVSVDFNGVDMNMGINHYRLEADGRGRFAGEGVLPVCIRDRMQWEALVSADTAQGRFAVPFRFESVK